MSEVSYNIVDLMDLSNNEETEIFKSSRDEIMYAISILEEYGIMDISSNDSTKIPFSDIPTKATRIKCDFIVSETSLSNEERGYSLTKDEVNDIFRDYLNWKAANE